MRILVIATLVGIAIAVALLIYLRRRQSHGRCANCGSPSKLGYSHEPESKAEDIVKLCLTCLTTKLKDDYQRYEGRALVIQPTAGFPCYVYQTSGKWVERGLAKDLDTMFFETDKGCNRCGSKAHYSWVTSNGLNASNLENVLSKGLQETLLQWGNARPIPLCAGCCVESVTKTIADRDLCFLEVCPPRSGDGFVAPMGY